MIITLIGMPGAGKSSVGKRLARLMGYAFIDTDNLIINAAGAPLQNIVDEQGDMALIGVEEQSILGLQLKDNSVIATGGSVVYSEKAMQFLKANSIVVYLNVPFEAIARRLSNIGTRGVVGLKGKGLSELYQERTNLYAFYADVTIKVAAKDKVQDVVTRIGDKLRHPEA
jgi:shikimate kinase